MEKEFKLLKIYMEEWINKLSPVLLDYQIDIYRKRGYIVYGHNGKPRHFPTFEQWKKIWNK